MRTRIAHDWRSAVTVALSMAAIAGSAFWMVRTHNEPRVVHAALQRGIGEALAERVESVLHRRGDIVVVTLEDSDSEALRIQLAAFRERLKRSPEVRISDLVTLDADKKAKYAPGAGFSASRLLRLVEKHKSAGALVSLVGLPEMDANEIQALGTTGPRLIGYSRNLKKLIPVLGSGRVDGVVVPRFQFPAPLVGTPRLPAEWFEMQCQWVSSADARQIAD